MKFRFFSILLVLSEFRIDRFLRYVNFMKHGLARGLYIIFLGTLMFGQEGIVEIIVGAIVIALGVLYIIVGRKMKYKVEGED